ncbi:hypothetical protein N0B31_22265 (plasmid) [Salinirubellus salinus]|uniref:DUF4350 domain-containing protein n=1 Tax=Salinirubellus salinus TaxID=1364945 RepID=A0A9E7UD57_9EURY|nr:DUF4350 domain-containing protein [Salinirubellus salinus]UWM56973.1 hypothetical protein N0B31_22265 [Salinirubellus salinus]
MSRYRTERWVALLAAGLAVVVLALLVGALTATDAPLDPYNHGDAGTSRLVDASREGLVLSYTSVDGEATPETVIIVGGGGDVTTADVAALTRHLDGGGRVVVLTEDERSNQLLAALDVETRLAAGYLLTTEQDSVSPAQFVVADGGDDALGFTGVQVNAAKPLGVTDSSDGTTRRVLAWSAPAGRDLDGDGQLGAAEPRGSYPVAVAEPVGAGQVIVVGDASLLTNGQWQVEGNRQLARALTEDGAMLVYPQTTGFPPVTRLRLGLNTPLGTLLGLPAFLCGGMVVVRLGVWLAHRGGNPSDRRGLVFTLR